LPGGLVPSIKNPPTRQGTRGANFLQIGIGARAQAIKVFATSSAYWKMPRPPNGM